MRFSSRKLAVTVATTLAVTATMLGSVGATLGADTRDIYIGSGPIGTPADIAATNGDLDYTPVTAGGHTATTVIVHNFGNQTLTHVVATFANLPSGFTIVDISGADAAACAGWSASLAVCDFGNLSAGAVRSFQIVFHAADAGAPAPTADLSLNESGNPNGANTHQSTATDAGFAVAAASCEALSTYVRGSGPKSVATCGIGDPNNANGQSSQVSFPGTLTTISLFEVGGPCPLVDGCIGDAVVADIVGDSTSDVLTWTLQVDLAATGNTKFNVNKLIVYHYNDAGQESPVGGIANKKTNECKTASQSNCIVSVSVSNNVLTVVYRSDGNGSTRLG